MMKAGLRILLLIWVSQSFAVDTNQLPDPKQQQAYEDIISELRCLVCQNQTIADSNADLATDLRRQVHEMLQQGKSKDDVVQFMTERYGDFVLYNPPFKAKTSLLWLGPVLFLLAGLTALAWLVRKKKSTPAAQENIDPGKREQIRRLLNNEEKP